MVASAAQIEADFRNLGISSGDTVMVHASLRAVGPVEGRAAGLVKALLRVLGDGGTLLAYVDYEPTREVPHFDPQNSPACSEYGVLPEVIRTWPGAVRSLNPGASMAAVGSRSAWLCRDHPMDYGYGPGSPLARLVEVGGKVLLLGSDPDQVTLLHYAEHCAKLPEKRVIRRTENVRSKDTIVEIVIEEFDTSETVVSAMPNDYFAQITRQFVDAGAAREGRVGRAPSLLLPARDFVRFAVSKMEREFG